MKSIQIDRDIYEYLLAQGLGAGQSASAILRRALVQTIDIDDDLYAYLLTLAVSIGESPSSILRRELKLDEHHPDPVDPPTRIEFRIPAGTGAAAWNAPERPVIGVVGQTLRIFNDDAVGHRLHTNGAPFPHGAADIAPGGSADFVLTAPFDLNPPQPLYDHNFGPPAQFWITVRPAG